MFLASNYTFVVFFGKFLNISSPMKNMNKSYLLVICLFLTAFTGCIEIEDAELEKKVIDDSEDVPLGSEDCVQITGQYLTNVTWGPTDEAAMDFLGTTYNESKRICIVSYHLVDIDEDKKLFVNEDRTRYVAHHQISGTSDDFTMVLLNRTYEIVERDLVIQGSIGSNGNLAVKLVELDGSIRQTSLWVSCKDDCFENAFENLCVVHGDLAYECDLVVGINIPEEELVKGCMDMGAINYNSTVDIDDGSCEYPPVEGCMDSNATNYDSTAEIDDGSCEYPPVEGCMDSNATNYDSAAEIDDGSCEYPPVEGCMDPDATNYDSEAEEDDGSCEYVCELVPYGHCSGEDLSGQDLTEMNLTGIDLSFADLSGADLFLSDLTGAYLEGADLTHAHLEYADLSYVDLTDADLTNAWLWYAEFTDAIVANTDFTDTYWSETIWIDGEMYNENQA